MSEQQSLNGDGTITIKTSSWNRVVRERDELKQFLAADSDRVDAYLGACDERDEARSMAEGLAEQAERLRKERDEAREEQDKAKTELEMWRDGNILHEIHRNELEKAERERDEAREALSPKEYAATSKAKREGTKKGEQFVKQPKKIAKKTAGYR